MKKVGKALTDSELGELLGISRQAATKLRSRGLPNSSADEARKWYEANINTGQNSGDVRAELNQLRARLLEQQAEGERLKNCLRGFEVRAAEEELVPAASADQIIETAVGPMLRALEGMESALKVKCNPAYPELAGQALREWSIRVRKQCVQALERLAKKLQHPRRKAA